MGNLTYAQLCAMTDDEQLTDERLAIMVHDGGLSEDEAITTIDQEQIAMNFERG